jgi:hypothetical protein
VPHTHPEFKPGGLPFARVVQDLARDEIWIPTLEATVTNPTLGVGGGTSGDVQFNGSTYLAGIRIDFGSSGVSGGSGNYRIVLPAELEIDSEWASSKILPGGITLNRAGTNHYAVFRTVNATTLMMLYDTGTSQKAQVAHNAPATWAANDFFTGSFEARRA